MQKISIFAVLLAMSLLCGCAQTENQKIQAEDSTAVTDGIPYQVTVQEDSMSAADGTALLVWQVEYPSIVADGALQTAVAAYFKDATERVTADAATYAAVAKDSYEEGGSLTEPYRISYLATVVRADDRVFSITADCTYRIGGAHDTVSYTAVSFDARSGERLTLAALGTDSDAVCAALTAQIAAQDLRQYTNDGFESALPYVLTRDSWCLDGTGLCVRFDPYEISPYAMHTYLPQLVLPYASLPQGDYQPT